MAVQDREITKAEFTRLWNKSYHYSDLQSIDNFLELFIDFHLKLADARDEGIHLEKSFQNELNEYRNRITPRYLSDPVMEQQLAKEAYDRLLYEVNASHILVRLSPGYSPGDTLRAWEKAMQIRDRIVGGEPFENVARATSDDPSAKLNGGNLGYFTVFQTVYPFETFAYNANPGEFSMPVRTRFGYHIIRVNDRVPSRGEIKTAHIMIGFNQYEESDARKKVSDIYRELMAGADFKQMATRHSTDVNSAPDGGVLSWFGAGFIAPDYEKAAFGLNTPGEITEPVRTPYGWHIIKLLERRDIPPFDEIKQDLIKNIQEPGDKRSLILRDALADRLKTEWEFSENPVALNLFYHLLDERIFDGNWTVPSGWQLNQILFRADGEVATQMDFAEFISESAYKRNPWPLAEHISNMYNEYVKQWLIKLEERNLEHKYPEFRLSMQEYKDGLLLHEITDRRIWSLAHSDGNAPEIFHERNKNNYMWGTRISATVFSTNDSRIAGRAERRAVRSMWFDSRDGDWVVDQLNRRKEEDVIKYEKGIYSRGENQVADLFRWIECVSRPVELEGVYHIIMINEVIEPEPKSFEEAKEEVISDFLEHIEKEWVKELRSKYNVRVNKDVLSTIKQDF